MLRPILFLIVFLLAIAACIAIFLAFANTISRPFQTCIRDERGQWSEQNRQQQSIDLGKLVEPQLICSVRFMDVHNGLFSAISAILLVIVTGGLVIVGYRQIETSRNQLRAQVYIATADMVNVAPLPPAAPGQAPFQQTPATRTNPMIGPFAILVIKNFGAMTAHHVVHFAGICLREFPLTTQLPPKMVVAPGRGTRMAIPAQNGTQKIVQLPNPLTNGEIGDLRNGTKAIYVYGDIEYRDGFGRKRLTNFRYFHNEFGGRVGLSGHLTGMEEGNDST